MKIEKTYPFKNYFSRGGSNRAVDKVVVVMGTGGTGGYLIPHLARYISLINKTRRGAMGSSRADTIKLVIVDGDLVEEKNLIRQNFIVSDIGKPKAEVLARRYSTAFGLDIAYANSFLETPEAIDRVVFNQVRNAKPIIVSCVDNNKTRRLIWKWYEKRSQLYESFWLDSGNEEHHGQIVVGYRCRFPTIRGMDSTHTDRAPFTLPNYFEMFPTAFEDLGMLPTEEIAARASCAEAALENPQTIFVNMMASQVLLNILQQILKHEPLNHHMVYFKTLTNQSSPVRLTEKNLEIAANKVSEFQDTLRELNLYDVAYKGKLKAV